MPLRKSYFRKRLFRKKKRVSKKVPKTVKRYVKKEIHKAIEDKVYMSDLSGVVSLDNLLILTPSSSTLPQYFSLIPSMAQGTSEMTRIGNRLRVKSHKLRVQMLLNGAAITAAGVDTPMNIYYFVLNTRDTPATLTASDLNQLFYYQTGGSASATQFLSGSGWATTHRINTDWFNIYKTNYPNKPIKLGWSSYASTDNGLFSNNDYRSNYHFDIDLTKKTAKRMLFSNNTSTPQNFNYYLVVYLQKINLNTTTVNWDPPSMFVTQIIGYEDA